MDMVGNDIVTLREGTEAYPMGFIFAPCSTDESNDGSIPFGTTITSAAITVYANTGKDITSTVCAGGASVSGGLRVDVELDFDPDAPNGKCKVLLALTLSDASVISKRWDGLYLE